MPLAPTQYGRRALAHAPGAAVKGTIWRNGKRPFGNPAFMRVLTDTLSEIEYDYHYPVAIVFIEARYMRASALWSILCSANWPHDAGVSVANSQSARSSVR